MLGPLLLVFLPIRAETEQLFSQAVPVDVSSSVLSEGSAYCRAKNSATDFPRTALVKKSLVRAVPAWCCALMHRMFDFGAFSCYMAF